MLDSKNFIKLVSIAKNIARSAGATAGTIATPSILADGEMVVTDMAGRILNTSTVVGQTKIRIVQARGIKTPPLKIFDLDLNSINLYTGDAYAAAVDQVTYIGYNGTSGTVEATGSTAEKRFITKTTPLPNSMTFGAVPFNLKDSLFVSPASSTSLVNAEGILKNLIISFLPNREIDFNPKFELVAADTFSAYGANTVVSMLFTKNSKQVTVTTGSSGATITAGTYIRIGGTTATTSPVYKVKTGAVIGASTTGTIQLELPFQGTSGTVLVAGLTNKAAVTGDVGVKISGVPMRYDVNRWRQYDRMRFTISLVNGYTTTTVTNGVGAFDGNGTWQQTMNDEYIYWGDAGQINPMQIPFLPREQDAEINNNYSVLNIGWTNSVEDTMVATGKLKGNIILYLNKTSGSFGTNIVGVGSPNTGLVNVLDAFVAQRAGFTAQIGNL
jgi:hypothetical protein